MFKILYFESTHDFKIQDDVLVENSFYGDTSGISGSSAEFWQDWMDGVRNDVEEYNSEYRIKEFKFDNLPMYIPIIFGTDSDGNDIDRKVYRRLTARITVVLEKLE
jgi:hypothetical protein